jgi:hypothetical protein
MNSKWKGIVISESLEEPSLLNEFDVYKARISRRDELIDDNGTKRGWYGHFWKGQKLLAVFQKKKFEFQAKDKSTWKEVVEYGKSIGIPEEQLDFPTE